MSDEIREQLSALMDGELPRDQVRFLLRRIDADAQLAQAWTRYQLAGGVLRRQAALAPLRPDFAEALMQRVAAGSAGFGSRVLRWAGGGAIAAAVAVFALVSTRPLVHSPDPATTLASLPAATAPAQAAPMGHIVATPLQPAFDFAQPASLERFDSGVIALPRYRHEIGGTEPAEMLGPYVLLTSPQQPGRSQEPQAAAQP
jgi:sigma-E factor negative regulatory protein RseA